MKAPVFFRTDGGDGIGLGHVMRCLALAQELKDRGWPVRFLTARRFGEWESFLRKEGMEVIHLELEARDRGSANDWALVLRAAKKEKPSWVVLDQYVFGPVYQRAIRRADLKLLCIDDIAGDVFDCDILVNPGIQAGVLNYRTVPGARRLLGTAFALIRREFVKDPVRTAMTKGALAKNILVSLGGGRHPAILAMMAEAFRPLEDWKFRFVMDVHDPENREVLDRTKGSSNLEVAGWTPDIRGHFHWADAAVAAAGGTCWELCLYGITGVCGVLSANQELIARELDRAGVFLSAGWFEKLGAGDLRSWFEKGIGDRAALAKRRGAGARLVDGLGASRIADEMGLIAS